MKVRIKIRPTGLYNGQYWPKVGETIDLPDAVAVGMLKAKQVEPAGDDLEESRPADEGIVEVSKPADDGEVEVSEPADDGKVETATPRRGRAQAAAKPDTGADGAEADQPGTAPAEA